MIDVESLIELGRGLHENQSVDPEEAQRRIEVAHFFTWLIVDNGYSKPRLLPDGRYAALAPFILTTAIIRGQVEDRHGIDDRWCYREAAAAETALSEWNGVGEPKGWHRHPGSGRRRAMSLNEFDGDNRRVTHIGQEYVRW